MKDYWSAIMFGAVLGAAAAALYYNQGHEISRTGRRVMARSRRFMDEMAHSGAENGYSMGQQG